MKLRDPSQLFRDQGFVVDMGIADEEILFKTHHVTSGGVAAFDGFVQMPLQGNELVRVVAQSADVYVGEDIGRIKAEG